MKELPTMIQNAENAPNGDENEKKNLFQILKEFFLRLIERDKKMAAFAHEMEILLDEVQTTNMLSLENFNSLMKVVADQKDVMADIEKITKEIEVRKKQYEEIQANMDKIKEELCEYSLEDWKENYNVIKAFDTFVAYSPTPEEGKVNAIVLDPSQNRVVYFDSLDKLARSFIKPEECEKGLLSPDSLEKLKNPAEFERLVGDTIDDPAMLDDVISEVMRLLPGLEAKDSEQIDMENACFAKELEDLQLSADKNLAYVSKYGSFDKEGNFNPDKDLSISINKENFEVGDIEPDEPEK